jgi:hypothetical protein
MRGRAIEAARSGLSAIFDHHAHPCARLSVVGRAAGRAGTGAQPLERPFGPVARPARPAGPGASSGGLPWQGRAAQFLGELVRPLPRGDPVARGAAAGAARRAVRRAGGERRRGRACGAPLRAGRGRRFHRAARSRPRGNARVGRAGASHDFRHRARRMHPLPPCRRTRLVERRSARGDTPDDAQGTVDAGCGPKAAAFDADQGGRLAVA